MGYRVAVVGATGNVGREMLATLAQREFPVDEVAAVASSRSAGAEVSFGEDEVLKVKSLDNFDFKGFDIALFSPGAKISAVHAPRAAAAGKSEEHTSELQSLMRISYAVFCLKKKTIKTKHTQRTNQ